MLNSDEFNIRCLLERWVIWRDGGEWEKLAKLWSKNGRMVATWFDGSAVDFMIASQNAWNMGVNVTHMLGGTAVEIQDDRCVAQTRMSITQRAKLEGSVVDVICVGRFYDFLVLDGQWQLAVRQCIYENDRMEIVAGPSINVPQHELECFPDGYCHLAYLQSKAGMSVSKNRPGRRGEGLMALHEQGRNWLANGVLP